MPTHRAQNALLALATFLALAIAPPAAGAPPGEEDHEELRVMLNTIAEAINQGSFELLEPIVVEPFAFTTSDQVTVTTVAEAQRQYDEVFKSGNYPVTDLAVKPTAAIETRFVDDNNGYCYGTAVETYTLKSGKEIDLKSTWTGTVTKVDGKWKLTTAHVGIHFFENPVVEMLGGTVNWAIAVSLVGGLIIGFLSCKLFGRGKRVGNT